MFVTNQQNVMYLTGFSGLAPNEREGYLLVTKYHAFLLTFPTYFPLYRQGGEGFVSLNITADKRISSHISDIVQHEALKAIGVEEDNLTISELTSLTKTIAVSFIPVTGFIERHRMQKDDSEIASIRDSARITDSAFSWIIGRIAEGISEYELAIDLMDYFNRYADGYAFNPIVAFNENAAIPHHLPSRTVKVVKQSLIMIDIGAKFAGYCSDMTRIVFFGEPKPEFVAMYETVLHAQEKALSMIKPGVDGAAIDAEIKSRIQSEKFVPYHHGLGHGVGLSIHEAPRMKENRPEILRERSTITVEPGIYTEGLGGVRIEDLVLLKDDGIEILSKTPKKILVI